LGRFQLRGLRYEIVGNLGVVSLIALLTTGFGVWLINGRHLLNRNLHYGKGLVESLSADILESLPVENPAAFVRTPAGQRAIEVLLERGRDRDPRMQILFVDPAQRVVVGVRGAAAGELQHDEVLSRSFAEGKTRVRLEGRAPLLGYFQRAVLAVPIVREGIPLGGVVAGLSLDDVGTGARQTVVFILLYMGLGTLIQILFGTIVLSRTLVRPLEKTIQVMRRVTEGDLQQRVASPGHNELGVLAETFNSMANRLQANQKSIEQHVRTLQRMNRELKQTQQEVIQSEKLASVGLLAAGVAHEIGNPLGAVLGYVGILRQGMEGEHERRDCLRRSEEELLRIHRIVKDLREYSRPSPCEIILRQANRIVHDTAGLIGRQREFQDIRFELSLAEGLPAVRVDEGQLQQVLVNLFVNAKDAVSGAGRIRVSTRKGRYLAPRDPLAGEPACRQDDPPGVDFRLLRRNNPAQKWPFLDGQELVEIEVEDNGSGIPETALPRIFDPFFTTKETGKGTGLGLSVSQRIIESFHGVVQVASRWGAGTTVRIQLPAADAEGIDAAAATREGRKDGAASAYH